MKTSWFPTLGKNDRPARRQQERRRRFAVELLEGRQMLSTFAVTNSNDSGTNSLRWASWRPQRHLRQHDRRHPD